MQNFVFLILGATLLHCSFSALAYLFVDAEVPRASQEELLNNLEEGVIVVEKDCSSVCFVNQAAKNFMTNPDFDASKVSNEDRGTEDRLFDWDKKMFAHVDKDIFSANQNADATQVAQ